MKINPYKTKKLPEYTSIPKENSDSVKDSFTLSQKEKEWTFLVYLDATKRHDKLAFYKLKELEKAGSSENINIVAEVTRNRHITDRFTKDREGTRRYYVTKNEHSKFSQVAHLYIPGHTADIKSPVLDEMAEQDLSDPGTFEKFLEWGMKQYPAKHYAVILSSPGAGVEGVMGTKTDAKMDLPEFAEAMKKAEEATGRRVDLTVVDESNSATLESAVELSDVTDYLVGSEGYLQGVKMPLGKSIDTIRKGIDEKGSVTPLEAAKAFVYETGRQKVSSVSIPTASVMDLGRAEEVTILLKEFSEALKDYPDKNLLRTLVRKSQQFSISNRGKKELVDLRDFVEKVSEGTKETVPAIYKIAQKLDKALDEMVVSNYYEGQSVDKAKGVAIYAPLKKDPHTREIAKDTYPFLKLTKETGWKDFVEELGTDKNFHKFLSSLGVPGKEIDIMTKYWDKICKYTLKGLKIGSVGLALSVLKSVISGTLGVQGKAVGLALGAVQISYGATNAYKNFTNEELERKIDAADDIYKTAQGLAVTSALTLPVETISSLGGAIVTPIAAMGGIYQGFKGAYDVFDAMKDKNLINKGEKIIDEAMESAKGIAVLATVMGIVLGLGAGFTTTAGIIAIAIPAAREIFRGFMGLKYLKDEEDPLTFQEKLDKIPELSADTSRYYISRTVEKVMDGIGKADY